MGDRSILWFALFSMYLVVSLFFGLSEKTSYRNVTISTVIGLAILVSAIPIIQNKGVVFGPDQWRDLSLTSSISKSGTFESTAPLFYYSLIPLLSVINVVVANVAGWSPMITFAVMQLVYSIIAIISIYLIVERLSGSSVASLLAVAIFLSTPRMTTVQVVSATASKALGLILILFMLEENRKLLYVVPFVAFTTTVIHPIGVIPPMAVIIGIILIGYIYPRFKLSVQTEFYLQSIFAIIFMVTLIYWSLDSRVLMGVFNPLKRLFFIMTSLEYSPSVYTPQYLESGFLMYSYAWAFPAAVSAAYALMFFNDMRRSSINRGLMSNFGLSSSFFSILMLMISFLVAILNPGASIDRYISGSAYVLMIFPSALVYHRIISTRKKYIVVIGLLMLSANIFLGNSSPSWAPFENPTFGSITTTYMGYIEAKDILPTIPSGERIYEDNDIPIWGVANLNEVDIMRDRSYQTVRVVIDSLKTNDIDLNNTRILNSLIFIKTGEIEDQRIYNITDVVYSNGFHSGLKITQPYHYSP
jgi:hypothetical protein